MKKTALLMVFCLMITAFCSCGGKDEAFVFKERSTVSESAVSTAHGGAEIEYLKYDDGSVIITKHSGAGEVEIPEKLDGMAVSALADSLFEGRTDLTAVSLPSSLEIIGNSAFSGCTALERVELGEAVWSIESSAFADTPWLAAQTDEFAVVGDGVLIRYNGSAKDVVIPQNIKHIAGSAFEGISIKQVDLASVYTVGKGAFFACSKLIRVDGGERLVLIGSEAFSVCVSLEEVVLPRTLQKVGENAFDGCLELAVTAYDGTEEEFSNINIASGNKIMAEVAVRVFQSQNAE